MVMTSAAGSGSREEVAGRGGDAVDQARRGDRPPGDRLDRRQIERGASQVRVPPGDASDSCPVAPPTSQTVS